jgi:hypothetical protein
MAVVLFSELNLDAWFEVGNHGNLEGDAPKGSVNYTFGFQHGLIEATNVLKWKIVKRELLFSKCRIACRFPESGQRCNHTCGSCMYLLPMTLCVGLSSFSYCVFSSRFVLSNSWKNLCLVVPRIPMGCYLVWTSTFLSWCIVNCALTQCCYQWYFSVTGKPRQLLPLLYKEHLLAC